MEVYVVVTMQNTPFPVDVDVFSDVKEATKAAEKILSEYEGNRVYMFRRRVTGSGYGRNNI